MEEVLGEIGNLCLNQLDNGWVQAIYYSEFLEFGEFPSEYESVLESLDLPLAFQNIMKCIDEWQNMDSLSSEEKSWSTLTREIQHEKLLAFLAYYIDYGIKNVVINEHRKNALLASRVYYKLLSVSGYKAYHIYHSQLFAHSLACLGFPKAMCDSEDSYFNTKELAREVNSVIKGLRSFVHDLRCILESLHLNPSDMNFEDILSNLVDVTGGAIVNKLNVDKIELGNISRVIYEMIDVLMCNSHNEPNPEAIQLLFKCLLPKLIAASSDNRSSNGLVRASYVTYSGLLLTKYGKAAISGYTILLEHLCFTLDGLERAEVRTARVSLVIGLMSLLPRRSYHRMVKWLLKLSTTSKVSHRHIAMEMLSNLLSNEAEESKLDTNNQRKEIPSPTTIVENQGQEAINKEDAPDEQLSKQADRDSLLTDDDNSQESLLERDNLDQEMTEEEIAGLLRQRPHTVPHAEILRAVYERVNDVSSTLRTRALTILTECVTSERPPMKAAIKDLNGSGEVSRLMAVGARSVCDERAAVRRAAVTLLHRLLATAGSVLTDNTDNTQPTSTSTADDTDMLHNTPPNPETPTDPTEHMLATPVNSNPPAVSPAGNDLAILVGLCRDASIIVRSAAIAALGDLVTLRPSKPAFDAFLSGPMHQLSDPENRIQEQVVTLVQQLLFDRLQKFVAKDFGETIPWMFLDGITRRNMRRHLQKACTLLVKTAGSISHRVIDILSTHLGAVDDERDLQCLVLLTSLAKHIDYSNIGFALEYYYKLADSDQPRDVRLMPFTLELISTWSRFANVQERSALRDHLVRRLAVGNDDGCRIPCVTLAAQLDPSNLQWATELLQMAERRALQGGGGGGCGSRGVVWEWVRAADVSLVAPAPPSPALLQLFLDALTDMPSEWSESERGACVAGAGRLCVRARGVAVLVAPVLAALLRDHAQHHAPRINALLVLTDICIRYTCIVEPLLECMCGCVSRATAPELRRAAARALTRLLLGGYLRLRTPLYYRYCALLADEDHDVREPAEYYVTCCLTTDAIYHHFVDCVIHYNKVDEENITFDSRQLIYDVMLQRMSLVQKLNIQCRLAREVLEHAADLTDEGDGDLPHSLSAALLDTITLLCGPRMKLPKRPQANGEPADIDDLQERVTTNIVSHKMKRTVAEVVVPAVLRLYSRLRPRGGQLTAYLVRLATDLLNDYRQEIEELIENDEEMVERVQQFQETIGQAPSFGNSRNLVTASAPPDPDTPRAPRRRAPRNTHTLREPQRKRALRI